MTSQAPPHADARKSKPTRHRNIHGFDVHEAECPVEGHARQRGHELEPTEASHARRYLAGVAERMDALIAEGHGAEDVGVLGQDAVSAYISR